MQIPTMSHKQVYEVEDTAFKSRRLTLPTSNYQNTCSLKCSWTSKVCE